MLTTIALSSIQPTSNNFSSVFYSDDAYSYDSSLDVVSSNDDLFIVSNVTDSPLLTPDIDFPNFNYDTLSNPFSFDSHFDSYSFPGEPVVDNSYDDNYNNCHPVHENDCHSLENYIPFYDYNKVIILRLFKCCQHFYSCHINILMKQLCDQYFQY
ncbi:unnamed protein product [Schistosoma margrebowiei]|nr:unnamed protein product [Schistosoma margrebowiei]